MPTRLRLQVRKRVPYIVRKTLLTQCTGAEEAAAEPAFGANADWEVSGATAGAFAGSSATAGAAAANWDAAAAPAGEDWAAAPGGSTEWGAATTTAEQQW